MKRVNCFLGYTLLLGIFAPLVAGCSSDEAVEEISNKEVPNDPVPMNLTAEQLNTVDAANDLSFRLFSEIVEADAVKDKHCISPLSIMSALSLTANGASDETVSNILEMFDMSGDSRAALQSLNNACKELVTKLPVQDRLVKYSMTNSFWHDPSYIHTSTFSEILSGYYGGIVVNQNPGGKEGKDKINKWVNDKTNGMIPKLLDSPLDIDYALLNTVYFKGTWTEPFKTSNTFQADFHNADGTKSKVSMMNDKITAKVYADNKFRMATLPFGNGSFSMSFIMGASDEAPLPRLTQEDWNKMKIDRTSRPVNIFLPKFDFEYGTDILDILNILYPGKFTSTQFTNIFQGGTADVNTFLHNTRIKVYEEGCEAAAVTVVGGITSDMPDIMRFDRPFYFVLHEKTTGAILFLGDISGF